MREYTEKEIKAIKENYDRDELQHGCGYWSCCLEHDCFCSMDAKVSKGFDIKVWDSMMESFQRGMHEYQLELEELEREEDERGCPDDDDIWSQEDPLLESADAYVSLVVGQATRYPRDKTKVITRVFLRPDRNAVIVILAADDPVVFNRIYGRLSRNLGYNVDVDNVWIVGPDCDPSLSGPFTLTKVKDGINFNGAIDQVVEIDGEQYILNSSEGTTEGDPTEGRFRKLGIDPEDLRYDWDKYVQTHLDVFGSTPQELYRLHMIHG
ncbi:MAG: hypothetical protein NC131_11340 [Roseburia sp.]|nr:hypothetical protein [Roseburia sp.]